MPKRAIITMVIFFKYTQVPKPLGVCARTTKSMNTGNTKASEVEQRAPISEMNKCSLGTINATPTEKGI